MDYEKQTFKKENGQVLINNEHPDEDRWKSLDSGVQEMFTYYIAYPESAKESELEGNTDTVKSYISYIAQQFAGNDNFMPIVQSFIYEMFDSQKLRELTKRQFDEDKKRQYDQKYSDSLHKLADFERESFSGTVSREINLSELYKIDNLKDSITINSYKILFPETALYEKQHFSRYNILNTKSDRRTKRIKLGDSCYRLYKSSVKGNTSSIFKVIDINTGEPVNLKKISYQDFTILKLALMRNKSFLRLVFSIIQELMKSVGSIGDSVFLKNTITIDPQKELSLNISWIPREEVEERKEKDLSTINISIL